MTEENVFVGSTTCPRCTCSRKQGIGSGGQSTLLLRCFASLLVPLTAQSVFNVDQQWQFISGFQ